MIPFITSPENIKGLFIVTDRTITVKQSLGARRTKNPTVSVLLQLTRSNEANYVTLKQFISFINLPQPDDF